MKRLAVGLTALVMCFEASAASLSFTNVIADFINPVGGDNVNDSAAGASTSIDWGDAATNNGQSGYVFDVFSGGNFNVNTPGLFQIGTFTHRNQPVYSDAIDSVDLMISGSLTFDNGAGGMTTSNGTLFTASFSHFEPVNYPQYGGPCESPNGIAGGGTPCADVAYIDTTSSSMIAVVLSGFMSGGTAIDFLISPENGNNSAILYGNFAPGRTAVPLPAAARLFLSAIGGAGALRRLNGKDEASVA